MKKMIDTISWDQDVTIYNKVVLKQLGIAFGIPFGLIFLFLAIQYISDMNKGRIVSFDGWQYALLLIGLWIALTALFLFVVYRNRFRMHYEINDDGIFMGFAATSRKKNKLVNIATIIAGGMAGKPSVAGAGLLAQSQQSVFLRWSQCKKYRCYPSKNRITIYNKFIEFMIVECTQENYPVVRDVISKKLPKY
ncbi:MAG: hypothetical protein PHI40_06845 [Caldisericia bacterium]|nr:hypothetical protein [Caldisericia bacterium]MDD4615102.1 hypothetical protein [Caldisericia bacterium]